MSKTFSIKKTLLNKKNGLRFYPLNSNENEEYTIKVHSLGKRDGLVACRDYEKTTNKPNRTPTWLV